ncbi:unnamed protein product [Peniophora sp. CBMAI 1063]|nr:unnamed protein product [Peniophora sp. CBMAI 1063]
MPALWGRVSLTNTRVPPEAFHTLLKMARDAHLEAYIESCRAGYGGDSQVQEDHYQLVLGVAKSLIPRIRVLSIDGVSYHPQDDLGHFFQQGPLPNLLKLYVNYHGGSWQPETLDRNICMDAPHLTELKLSLFELGLPMADGSHKGFCLDIPNVKTLLIEWRGMSFGETTMWNLRWIATVIQNGPLIENLAIDLAFWHFEADWFTLFNGQNALLYNLRSLIITQRSMCMHTGDFLTRICPSPPPAFTFTARYIRPEDVVPIAQSLAPYLAACASYSTMYIRFCHPMWVMIHVLPKPSDARALSEEKTFNWRSEDNLAKLERQTTLSLSTLSNLHISVELLPDLASRLHLAQHTHLHVNGGVNPAYWWYMFRHLVAPRMTSVHTFIIDNLSWLGPKAGDMNALSIIGPPDHGLFEGIEHLQTWTSSPLPALRTLIVTSWVTGTKSRKRLGLTHLVRLLIHRLEIGLPVHSVYLRGGWMNAGLAPKTQKDKVIDSEALRCIRAAVTGEVFDERVVLGP